MKTKYFFLAALAGMTLASCSSDEFVGDTPPSTQVENTGAIKFSFDLQKVTRGDIYGDAAAALLGNNFYVTGTKGTEGEFNPTEDLVFDNYLVNYAANTAGTTESNTANWEYVGVTPGVEDTPYENYVKLSSLDRQTIKYWDYSTEQYDFFAFSTGTYDAVRGSSTAATNIGVTPMLYGEDLSVETEVPTAYTFSIPSLNALENAFITDIVTVAQTNYGNEVTLKFKNLGSKVRLALYETIPGYSVKDVIFYTVDNEDADGDVDFSGDKSEHAALISADETYGFPTAGTISVRFQHVGTTSKNATPRPQDYNKADATVSPTAPSDPDDVELSKDFDVLDNFQSAEEDEDDDDYLGRKLTEATFAGSADASYYQTVFPITNSHPLTLRVDYTLVSIDGSGEEINVYGAKAVVPSTYTQWLPNYAYTYIFKISDNTNGWTDEAGTKAGLFPITFDAVVAEATDATAEQTTITTVATPSITTYQKGHDYSATDEYDNDGENIYVQVMDNSTVPATLVTNLDDDNSLLFAVTTTATPISEATVMDALEKRTTAIDDDDVTGRNGITLTKNTNISNEDVVITKVDGNTVEPADGEAAEIIIDQLEGTYAYVYVVTAASTDVVTEYQPITVSGTKLPGDENKKFYTLKTDDLDDLTEDPDNFTTAGDVDNDYIYFSVTTNGTDETTYSYVSVAGKKTIPAGLLKVAKTSLSNSVGGGSDVVNGTFYFDKYISNDGVYAVKVIKVV